MPVTFLVAVLLLLIVIHSQVDSYARMRWHPGALIRPPNILSNSVPVLPGKSVLRENHYFTAKQQSASPAVPPRTMVNSATNKRPLTAAYLNGILQETPTKRARTTASVQPQKRRRVGFNLSSNEVRVAKCPTEVQKRDVWFSDDEIQRIQQDAFSLVSRVQFCEMDEKLVSDEDVDSIRGLEFQLDPVTYRRKSQHNRRFIATILDQQKLLRRMGGLDQDNMWAILARLSSDASQEDQYEAFEFGALDASQSEHLSLSLMSPVETTRREERASVA